MICILISCRLYLRRSSFPFRSKEDSVERYCENPRTFLVCFACCAAFLVSQAPVSSAELPFGSHWIFVAFLTLTLFVPCAFAKTNSGTRYTARLRAEAVGRRTPQLTAMRMEAQGQVPISRLTYTPPPRKGTSLEQSIRGNVVISQLSQQSDADRRRSGEACRIALRGRDVDSKRR